MNIMQMLSEELEIPQNVLEKMLDRILIDIRRQKIRDALDGYRPRPVDFWDQYRKLYWKMEGIKNK